MNLALV